MDATGPPEGRRETGAEQGETVLPRRPLVPADGKVVVQDGLVSFWCARCVRWVDAHIEIGGAKAVHERIAHPGSPG